MAAEGLAAVRINLDPGLNMGSHVLIRFPNVIQFDCSFYTKELRHEEERKIQL